jgi:hypothetical protein
MQAPQRNIWDSISGSAVPRHWMGAWLTYRKLASLSQLPNSDLRAQLAGLYPMDYGFDFVLKAQQTGDQRSVIMKNWVLLAMSCKAFLTGGIVDPPPGTTFQAQIYVGKYKQGVALSDRPINGANQFGGQDNAALVSPAGRGMLLRYLRTPLWIPPNTPILIRVQNLNTSTSTNNVEIVLQGVGE